jgi:hypothetical protein
MINYKLSSMHSGFNSIAITEPGVVPEVAEPVYPLLPVYFQFLCPFLQSP